MKIAKGVFEDVRKIREQSPLVHNITNYVVMNSTANALLCLGASPVMAHAVEEVEEMVSIASALVINIGTLSKNWIEAMKKAVDTASKKGIPWILDPVGAGATSYRTKTTLELIDKNPPAIIRGNASEILSVIQAGGGTKGVDSSHSSEMALSSARELVGSTGSVICISGAVDIIVDEKRTARVQNGHSMMPKVTGLGCTASALVGAFAAVNSDPFRAACHAMAVMGIAGEMAAAKSNGPGTLQLYFLDALFNLAKADVERLLRVDLA